MPMTSTILRDFDINVFVWSGVVDLTDLRDRVARSLAHPEYYVARHRLIDARRIEDMRFSLQEYQAAAALLKKTVFREIEATKMSMLVTHDWTFGIGRQWEALTLSQLPVDFLVTQSEADAIAHLERTEKTITQLLSASQNQIEIP